LGTFSKTQQFVEGESMPDGAQAQYGFKGLNSDYNRKKWQTFDNNNYIFGTCSCMYN